MPPFFPVNLDAGNGRREKNAAKNVRLVDKSSQ
jgi:hypothetical protein